MKYELMLEFSEAKIDPKKPRYATPTHRNLAGCIPTYNYHDF